VITHEEKLRVDRLAVEQRRTLRALTRDALAEYCDRHERNGNGAQATRRTRRPTRKTTKNA
jgi:predicted transcriptional regulator